MWEDERGLQARQVTGSRVFAVSLKGVRGKDSSLMVKKVVKEINYRPGHRSLMNRRG